MDNVRGRYSSTKPVQFEALAHAQGTEIHLAADQEKHLPQEACMSNSKTRAGTTNYADELGGINDDRMLFHYLILPKASLSTFGAMKKPFCFRRMAIKNFSRDERIRTSGLTPPRRAL